MSDVVFLRHRRTGQVAPPNLRPAPLSPPEVADLTHLLSKLPPRERER